MAEPIPHVSKEQMIEVDRAMIEDYGIELIQMMENAGRNLAQLSRDRFLDGDPRGRRVVVLAGKGGNGGGALVCARRLHAWGATTEIVLSSDPDDLAPIPAHQLDILQKMGLPIRSGGELPGPDATDLIVDGLIGYSQIGDPRGAVATLIEWANESDAPVLSLDVPSGLDATTGALGNPVIQATATLTLALPKDGLRASGVEDSVGELYLADIGVPPELYRGPTLGLNVGPIFAQSEILRIR